MPALLFLATVLIWGSTWLAIKMQVGAVAAPTAVFWRFAVAAAITLLALALTGRLRLPRRHELPWLAGLGLCIFSANFLLLYTGSRDLPSGLVSVVFATSTLMNAVAARLVFGEPLTARAAIAALCGIAGLFLLFEPQMEAGLFTGPALQALLFCVAGTAFFSAGNMVSRRNSAAGLPVVWANAWGMSFGAGLTALVCLVTGTGFAIPLTAGFVGPLLYLAVIGSIIGFATYLGLVARIGPARAAYTTVLFPIVALTLSWAFEGYEWTPQGVAGLALVLGGNVVMFARRRAARPA